MQLRYITARTYDAMTRRAAAIGAPLPVSLLEAVREAPEGWTAYLAPGRSIVTFPHSGETMLAAENGETATLEYHKGAPEGGRGEVLFRDYYGIAHLPAIDPADLARYPKVFQTYLHPQPPEEVSRHAMFWALELFLYGRECARRKREPSWETVAMIADDLQDEVKGYFMRSKVREYATRIVEGEEPTYESLAELARAVRWPYHPTPEESNV